MDVFLTGASGYVGSAVARELARRGHHLTVLARSSAEAQTYEDLGWKVAVGGLENDALLRDLASSVDAVAHCAASDAPAFLPINVKAVASMIGALGEGCGFVSHAGTLLFGPTGPAFLDGTGALAPPPFLAARAQLDEEIMKAGSRLRVATVYAALAYGSKGAAIPNAMIAAGRALGYVPYPGDGAQVWTSVHISDWAALMADALERAPRGGARYVAAGRPVSVAEAASLAGEALGVPARAAEGAPLAALAMFADALRLDQRFVPTRAHGLGWIARVDDLAAGMAEAAG